MDHRKLKTKSRTKSPHNIKQAPRPEDGCRITTGGGASQKENTKQKEVHKMEITTKQIDEAIKAGYHVTIIINGEYYDYEPDNNEKENAK